MSSPSQSHWPPQMTTCSPKERSGQPRKWPTNPARVSLAGGLLAGWAIRHTPKIHRVVARRPVVDWATDIARAAPVMGAMPWEDPDQYMKHSPLFFAQNFRTPTLILAGDADVG